MLVREAIERFERGLVGQGASRNTVSTYRRNLDRFAAAFAEKVAEEITVADLNEFLFSVRLKADGCSSHSPHAASLAGLASTRALY